MSKLNFQELGGDVQTSLRLCSTFSGNDAKRNATNVPLGEEGTSGRVTQGMPY